MFRLRKWKNFPYVTYLIGMTFLVLYLDWFFRQPLLDQSSPHTADFPPMLSAAFRHVVPESDPGLGLYKIFGVLAVMGIVEILLVRWWAYTHRR